MCHHAVGEKMKTVEIKNGIVYKIYTEFENATKARCCYASTIHFEDAPDDVFEGCTYSDGIFSRPKLDEGWAWDDTFSPPVRYNILDRRSSERLSLHSATTNDTLQALRKIREGDTSYDWQSWLAKLDAYNVAIEKTKEQESYPRKVVYPEYPTR